MQIMQFIIYIFLNSLQSMHTQQHQEIRPFTFYKENADFEDTIREELCNTEEKGIEERSFLNEQKEKKCKMLRKLSKKCSDVGLLGRLGAIRKQSEDVQDRNRESLANNHDDRLIEKGQERKGKLAKISFKKINSSQQNSRHLKAHLQELLKNDLIQTQDQTTIEESKCCLPIKLAKQRHNIVNRSQIITSPVQMNEYLSLGRMEKKEKILFLHAPKNDRANFINLVFSKNADPLQKMTEKLFPRIIKKSHSMKMKDISNVDRRKEIKQRTRYQNPDRHDDQSYLQPIKTDRNTRKNPYKIKIESLHPRDLAHCSTEKSNIRVIFHSECEQPNTRLLLQATKCIKFK